MGSVYYWFSALSYILYSQFIVSILENDALVSLALTFLATMALFGVLLYLIVRRLPPEGNRKEYAHAEVWWYGLAHVESRRP